MKKIPLIAFWLFIAFTMKAQQVLLEGYVFEKGNRGYIENALIEIENDDGSVIKLYSDEDGFFQSRIISGKKYELKVSGDLLEEKLMILEAPSDQKKIFLKIEMQRKPGYLFDITLAEKKNEFLGQAQGIHGALIEVYNNTKEELIMVLEDHSEPGFQLPLVKGNHYTILIRKEGFIARRLEAFVDVEGCILCFEGLGSVDPAVSDNLSEKNTMGVILANITMERAFKGKKLEINNLYYDFGKWDLRKESKEELDKVLTMMKDNPGFIVELGSHTDSRGSNKDNMVLSDRRASAAVRYLLNKGINKKRISAKGYGESMILNHCKDDIDCTEEDHQVNRRTELKIIGLAENPEEWIPLAEMKREQKMEELLEEIQFGGQIKVGEGQVLIASQNTPMDSIMIVKDTIDGTNSKGTEFLYDEEEGVKVDEELPAEEDIKELSKVNNEFEELINIELISKEKTKAEAEEISGDLYSGIKIAIKISHQALPEDHDIFKRHNNIYIIEEGTAKIYTIGTFKDRNEAEEFLNTSVKMVYPAAFIVEIVDGKLLR